jgi:hypothetical protein
VRESNWRDTLRLSGIADLVVSAPGKPPRLCVVEFKLGYTSPEADLAQACLYHQLLAARSGDGALDGSGIALVSFEPQLRERFYPASKIESVKPKLTALIGRLAGVLPGHEVPQTRAVPPTRPPAKASEEERRLEQALLKTCASSMLLSNALLIQ